MDPIDILKREWLDQLELTLEILRQADHPMLQDCAIDATCDSLRRWLKAQAKNPHPLAPNPNTP